MPEDEPVRPSWTVLYNRVVPGSRWIGKGWEFFDDEASAKRRYDELLREGHCPTKRPYHSTDRQHLGAVHSMNGEG